MVLLVGGQLEVNSHTGRWKGGNDCVGICMLVVRICFEGIKHINGGTHACELNYDWPIQRVTQDSAMFSLKSDLPTSQFISENRMMGTSEDVHGPAAPETSHSSQISIVGRWPQVIVSKPRYHV